MKQKCKLEGVPETMLWPFYNRVSVAKRPNSYFKDPKGIEIFDSIDYDYEKHFGKPDDGHAVRAIIYDKKISMFIKQHPNAVIVNFGEGIETHRFRIDAPDSVTWITIDLPEAIDFREKFIQPDENHLHIKGSALNFADWEDKIPKDRPLLFTAQGLLMYFEPKDLESFFKGLAERYHSFQFMFCFNPPWLSKKTMSEKGWQKTKYYTAPKMPWGIYRDDVKPTLEKWIGSPVSLEFFKYHFPHGIRHYYVPILYVFDFLWKKLPGTCLLTFSEEPTKNSSAERND